MDTHLHVKRSTGPAIAMVLAFLLAASPLYADRILVIGDSWASPVAPELQIVLHENGFTGITVEDTPFIGGARDMRAPATLNLISTWLDERPDVTVVQMSVGANDWLNSSWTPSFAGTALEEDLIATIIGNVEVVVDHIVSLRPDIRILWPSYDFPRPVNRGVPVEINAFMIKFAERIAQFAADKPGLGFVDMNGTLQVAYGFDGIQHTSFDPDFVIPPGDPSLPDPGFPSPFKPFLPNDSWHLVPDGYKALAQAQYDGYYTSLLAGENFQLNAGLNDAWYNPDTDGQGFFITVFPDLGKVSLAWFTYDTELPPVDSVANLGDPGHRWLTALGSIDGNQAIMNITLTSAGLFDTATEIERTDPPGSDGIITLTFEDCNSATVEYDIPAISRQGTIPIVRVANDNIVLCEALLNQ